MAEDIFDTRAIEVGALNFLISEVVQYILSWACRAAAQNKNSPQNRAFKFFISRFPLVNV